MRVRERERKLSCLFREDIRGGSRDTQYMEGGGAKYRIVESVITIIGFERGGESWR